MTTRNLVPRADSQGKIGISGTRWEEVNAVTIKATSLQNSNGSSLLVNDAGIKDIATVNNQLVIALDGTFLTDRLGFNADSTKPDFTLPSGADLPDNTIIAAGDSLVSAIQKLNDSLRDVAAPTNLTVNSFTAATIVLESEGISNNDNDTTLPTSAAVKDYVDSQINLEDLDLAGDSGTGAVDLNSQSLTIAGGTGLTSAASDQTITLNIDNTAVTPGNYGSSTAIPTFTVDQQGRLTAAGSEAISTKLTLSADSGTDDEFLIGGTLTFAGTQDVVSTTVSNDTITIDLVDTDVTAGSYGSATAIPTFTVDAQGRLTAAGSEAISTKFTLSADSGTDDEFLVGGTLTFAGTQDVVSTTVSNDTITIDLVDTDVTAGAYGDANSVGQFTVDAQGRLTQAASVDISITSSQVSDATAVNTPSTIVERDGSGNFAAGTITATLSGNASTASAWQTERTISLGGVLSGSADIDGSGDETITASIVADSINLTTDTASPYISMISTDNGISISNDADPSGNSPTISLQSNSNALRLNNLGDPSGADKFIVSTGNDTFAWRTKAQVRTSIDLGTEDTAQFAGVEISDQGSLDFKEGTAGGNNKVSLRAPSALENDYILTLPTAAGTENQVLITDGAGGLSFANVTSASGSTDSFAIIAVSGQNNLVADTATDTLTFEAGSGIALTTTAADDKLAIAVSNIDNDDIAADAEIVDTKLATISTADKVSLSAINIDGAADIGAALADADLIIVDDGAGGTNRKSAMSRVAAYINDHSSITTLSKLTSIGEDGEILTAAGNLTVSGNLIVNGDSTTVTTSTLTVQDSLISLAKDNNATDTLDIGFYGLYDSTGSQDLYTGLFRDADDGGKFKLFKDLQAAPTATVNTAGAGYAKATLVADIEGNVTGNADTSSEWATARTVTFATGEVTGSFSIKGNADVTNVDLSISNESVTSAMLAGSIADGKLAQDYIQTSEVDDSSIEFDSGSLNVKALGITNAMLAGSIADGKLAQDYIQTSEVDDSSIEFDSGSLNIKALGVTNAMLAGSIADGKLAQDYIQTSEVDDSSIEFDSGSLNIKALGVTNAMLAGSISSDKLAGSIADGKLAQDYIQTSEVDDSSIEFESGSLNVKALGITNAMLAGSIADGKLAQNYIQASEVDDSSIEFSGGSLNVKAAGITDAMLATDYIQAAEVDDSSIEFESGSLNIKALGVTNAMLAGSIADGKLAADYVQVGEVDDSSIEFNGGSLNVKALGITNAMLAGSIADSKLSNISTANKVKISSLDIDEANVSVSSVALADSIIIDQSSNGTNRTATLTKLRDLFQTASIITSLPSLATVGTIGTGVWQGTAIADAYVASDLTISGGSVNNSPIGASSHSTGKFTTLQATTSLQLASGATITGINDTDNMSDASATTVATSESIKAYVDAQITAQDLDFATDTGSGGTVDLDSETLTIQGTTNKIGVTHADQTITVNVGSDIVQLTETQTLTNKTLTSPKVTDLNIVDTTITFEGDSEDDHELVIQITEPTADRTITIPDATDTLVGKATTDTLTNKTIVADDGTNSITNLQTSNLKAGVLDTDLSSVASDDTTLASAKAIKAYVDEQLGRFGGIFLTDSADNGKEIQTVRSQALGIDYDYTRDVIFDASPLVRSHFGPFAFDLQQLRDSAFGSDEGSDIIFYGATAAGASDRHFLVVASGDDKGDTKFTGAHEETP